MGSWLLGALDDTDALPSFAAAGADRIVLDFAECRVEGRPRDEIREAARDWLRAQQQQVLAHKRFERWVRIGGLNSPDWRGDLAAAMTGAPDGVMLGAVNDPAELQEMAALIYEYEQREHLPHNSIRIAPSLGGTARAALFIRDFADAMHPRVDALTWSAENLAKAIGANRHRKPDGSWIDPLAQTRSQVILLAHAHRFEVIEAPCPARTEERLVNVAAKIARTDGCQSMMAFSASHVAAIAAAFGSGKRRIYGSDELSTLDKPMLNVA